MPSSDDRMRFVEPEIAWVHVSDIHFGSGSTAEAVRRAALARELTRDARSLVKTTVRPDLLLVTGDLAQTGGSRSEAEYDDARSFLTTLASSTGIEGSSVLVVPGNHDVDRDVAKGDDDIRRWLDELREGKANIEGALSTPIGSQRLKARQQRYLDFSAALGIDDVDSGGSDGLFWALDVTTRNGNIVRIGGGNSALLSQDDDDEGRLQMGVSQLEHLLSPDGDQAISVLLTHHPLTWMRDTSRYGAFVRRWADLHLYGHVHSPDAVMTRVSGGSDLVEIVAGATYDANDELEYFTYSFVALYRDETRWWVRIWPRRYSSKNAAFRVDVELVPDGQQYVDLPIGTPQPRAQVGLATGVAGDSLADHLLAEAKASVRRLGSRRTAYPLDMSIAELYDRGLFIEPRIRDYWGGPASGRDLTELVERVALGQNVLVLGEPGTGKSVAAYALLRRLGDGQVPVYLRMTEARELAFGDQRSERLAYLLAQLAAGRDTGVVMVLDGLDETLGEFAEATDVVDLVHAVSAYGPVVVTCRRREFEDLLASSLSDGVFDAIQMIEEWRPDVEFSDFVSRLSSKGMLPVDDLVERVLAAESLSALVRRPLFARMLTFLPADVLARVADVDALYAEYVDRLATSSDRALRTAGCAAAVTSSQIWQEGSWHIFSKALFVDETFSLGAVNDPVAASLVLEPRCVNRGLSQITDQWRVAGRVWARFVHYSFFEYCLASYYMERLEQSRAARDSASLGRLLRFDLSPEVRHFLVGRMRRSRQDGLGEVLHDAYQGMTPAGLDLAQRRTMGNLVCYLLSRGLQDGGVTLLSSLLESESDPFLRQSLSWALCHLGSDEAMLSFLDALGSSEDERSLNRGYLMYYYGDLDRRLEPPYVDPGWPSGWGRTRERTLRFMSSSSYPVEISAQRRAIDLFTLCDFAISRGTVLSPHEAQVAEAVLDRLLEDRLPNRAVHLLNSGLCAATPEIT